MGESAGDWGALASDPQREAWDSYASIPEPGENKPLDGFLTKKNLDHGAIVRIGARLSAPTVLAFAFEGGLKFRDVITGRRWSWTGATFDAMKVVPGRHRDTAIICEGETDAARLTMLYDADVCVLPAGARTWKPRFTEQVTPYKRVLVGLDNDEAGEAGYEVIKAHVPRAVRFRPPGVKDWCALEGDPPELPPAPEHGIVVMARDLFDLDYEYGLSWFDGNLLPVAGSMLIHGWTKSYKSFVALDILAAIAQGEPWAAFPFVEEPAKVVVVNYEISFPYFRERVGRLRGRAAKPDLFDENFGAYSPLVRPRFTAGNPDHEKRMLLDLQEAGAQVVLFDPVRRAIGRADPNAEQDARMFLSFAEDLNREGITVLYVSHDNKAGARTGGGQLTDVTGSGAWVGDGDSIIGVSRPRDFSETERLLRFTLRNAAAPQPRKITMGQDGVLSYSLDVLPEQEGSIEF